MISNLFMFFSLKECLIIVPSVGYNKFLIPPPIGNDKYLVVNFSMEIRETIYINEEEKFLRSKTQNTKEWYNTYLTFQNLKNSSNNPINSDDMDNMWLANYDEINTKDEYSCARTEDTHIFKVVPQNNFDFVLNSRSEFYNAHLFEARKNSFFCERCSSTSFNLYCI